MKRAVWLTVLLLASSAWAHSYLVRSMPKAGQTVRVMPQTVQLEFSEPLEVNFSSFKIYALPASSNPQQAAIALRARVLALKNDTEARADASLVSNASPVARLELKLKDKLPSGWYVVMWRALSIDGHVTTDQFAFLFQPRP